MFNIDQETFFYCGVLKEKNCKCFRPFVNLVYLLPNKMFSI
jgi:hypothetical protein